MKSRGVTVKTRIELKIDADLKEWAVRHAKAHHVTLTTLICAQLAALRAAETKRQQGELVEQF